jgi:hypothetical protein
VKPISSNFIFRECLVTGTIIIKLEIFEVDCLTWRYYRGRMTFAVDVFLIFFLKGIFKL